MVSWCRVACASAISREFAFWPRNRENIVRPSPKCTLASAASRLAVAPAANPQASLFSVGFWKNVLSLGSGCIVVPRSSVFPPRDVCYDLTSLR